MCVDHRRNKIKFEERKNDVHYFNLFKSMITFRAIDYEISDISMNQANLT